MVNNERRRKHLEHNTKEKIVNGAPMSKDG